MSDLPILVVVVVVAFAGIAALVAIAIGRLSTLIAARDGAVREAADLKARLDILAAQNADFERDVRQDLANARTEQAIAAQGARTELAGALAQLGQSNEGRLEAIRQTVEQKLDALRVDNSQKLEQMRATVDEKLQSTLEKRLGESFKLVSDRLEQVHKGLGEMQSLATGVGDLKKVLTNIKTRGTWGEVQLENLLEQMLTPAQYERNIATRPGRNERVEFAIRLPGRGEDKEPFWLPIDAKFPLEDFQRLQDAQERADLVGVESFGKALEDRIRKQAKDIHDKYVEPPYTTDFALLYLPVESLYAEVLRRPGLADIVQRESQVTLAGPTTLAAILNSLQMGFRTLAIEQRSGEVWRLLAAVKTDFVRFGDLLAKTKKQLDSVSNTLGDAEVRTRSIERKLRGVEALPAIEADRLLTEETAIVYELDFEADAAARERDLDAVSDATDVVAPPPDTGGG
jgi:DNA recombination protein RmuC